MRSRWALAVGLAVAAAGCSANGGPGDTNPTRMAQRACEADVTLKTDAELVTVTSAEAVGDGYMVRGTADGHRWSCAASESGGDYRTESVVEG